jgi:hypothetical protein
MPELLDYTRTFARFPFALRRFLTHKLTLEESKRIVRERIDRREETFLHTAEHRIYGYPRSPYRALLQLAGCELGDLRAMVGQKGLEGTLRALRAEGVYVTFEEFKGRKAIVRSGHTISVRASDFDNPSTKHDFIGQTGGSTGAATQVGRSLEHSTERAPNEMISLAAFGLLGVPTANWGNILPVASPAARTLMLAFIGQPAQHWFSQMGWRDTKHWLLYDLATLYFIFWMRLFGLSVPIPEVVRGEKAIIVARWVHAALKTSPRVLLYSGVSRALRVCIAAREAGLDLAGAFLRGGGEPVTRAKIEAIRQSGAHYIPLYAMAETGYVATGCAHPSDGSDVHLLRDAFALFTHPHYVEGPAVSVPAFNITTLLPTVPKLMLNVQMDDYGIFEERACGCALEECGYTTHLHEIHSYSKLLSEGVTLIGSEMLRILDEILPQRFGGTPLDYQLMEEEDAHGLTRVYLLISPRIEIQDEAEVIRVLLAAMRDSSGAADSASAVWRQANTIRIKRQEPIPSARGKLLPLRIQNRAGPLH